MPPLSTFEHEVPGTDCRQSIEGGFRLGVDRHASVPRLTPTYNPSDFSVSVQFCTFSRIVFLVANRAVANRMSCMRPVRIFCRLPSQSASGVRFTAEPVRELLGLSADVCEMEHTSLARRSKVSHRDSESEAFDEVTTFGYGIIGTISA